MPQVDTKKKPKTVLERGMQLMLVPIGQLPVMAWGIKQAISSRLGCCGEVCLTAYCIYAEVMEGYEAKDIEYAAASFPEYSALLKKPKLIVNIQFVD